ncbi:MAG: TetR/AcrR family transcriptional regulator [Desulfobacterium sp.]
MNYIDFQKQIKITRKSICRDYFHHHQDAIRIKKEETVVRNLEKIFNAALKISNTKGFQAMSMRDLAKETGLSTGALYAYFSSKNDLLNKMQSHRRNTVMQIMESYLNPESDALEQLNTMIKVHLYLSEAMQPWFYFSYMESKNMSRSQRKKLLEGSLATEKVIADIIRRGQEKGVFKNHDADMTAGMIKALLQDWYLKHKKHARRRVSVDQYADFIQLLIIPYIMCTVEIGRS